MWFCLSEAPSAYVLLPTLVSYRKYMELSSDNKQKHLFVVWTLEVRNLKYSKNLIPVIIIPLNLIFCFII